jgi:pimeloyl-ACP methyl ester carboxylesterase
MARVKRWLSRIAVAWLVLVLFVILGGFTYEQIGRTRDASHLPPRIGKPIDIGGRSLNLYCSGEGSPAVILEAGANAPGYSWALVQPKLAEFTRACWYDRAGVGWSDPPTSPRTSVSVTSDLHEMLRHAGVLPPYVLVGASIGGEYARTYTAHYPDDVVGLVLVDSSHPDQHEPYFMVSPANRLSAHARHLLCTALPVMSRFGLLRYIASKTAGPVPQQFSAEQRNTLAMLHAQPNAFESDAEQACAATNSGKVVPDSGSGNPELDNAARNAGSLGNRPLVVPTAGRYFAPAGLQKEADEYHEIWVHQLQASLAGLSTRSRQVVVDAHHDIGDEAPDAVVTAVQQVVAGLKDCK